MLAQDVPKSIFRFFNSSPSPETIGQLHVEGVDEFSGCFHNRDASKDHFAASGNVPSGCRKSYANSGQLASKNCDDVSGVSRYDGRTGQSLYAGALKINHIDVDCTEFFTCLARNRYICVSGVRNHPQQAELVFYARPARMKRYRTEWEPDNCQIGAENDAIGFIPAEIETRKFLPINLENCNLLCGYLYCNLRFDWNNLRDSYRTVGQGNRNSLIGFTGLWIITT